LPLRPIIQQKRQCATKREDDERFQDIRINVVCIFVVDDRVVVICFVVVPAGKFGFEKGGEPFGESLVFLGDLSN
jgi:hypothetical protein